MKYSNIIRVLAFLGLALGSLAGSVAEESGVANPGGLYKVLPGDVLVVSVWKEEGLTDEVLVRPDGMFSFPLAGDIDANGKTVEALRQELSGKIEKYIPDPVVTVSLRQIQGNRIYVLGQVNRPGPYVMIDRMDVMQALALAGGLSTFAAVNDIKILRRTAGSINAIPFRYSEVEDGENLEQIIQLRSGDVVVVP